MLDEWLETVLNNKELCQWLQLHRSEVLHSMPFYEGLMINFLYDAGMSRATVCPQFPPQRTSSIQVFTYRCCVSNAPKDNVGPLNIVAVRHDQLVYY